MEASYRRMSDTFRENGLDLQFIEENSTKYSISELGCTPLDYTALPEPLAEGNVRLCVLPLEEAHDLGAMAALVTDDIRALLPHGTASYPNPLGLLHITVFHFSRPDDPRPVSMSAKGADEVKAQPISQRAGPTYSEVCCERRLLSQYVSSAPPMSALKVHSVVFAASGTLLLVYTDASAELERMRMHLRTGAPGAPEKQASIIHTTLLRVLTPVQLPRPVIEAIQTRCEHWTRKLRGTRLCITRVWYIVESLFATIDGDRTVMHFKAA